MDTDYFSWLFSSVEVYPPSFGAILSLVFAVMLLGASGFVSASEVAFFSLTPQDLQSIKDNEDPRDQKIFNLLNRSEFLLATILIANNLINVSVIVLCNYAISDMFNFGASPVLSYLLQTVVLTFLLLLFGEIMPKIYASNNSLRFSRRSAGILNNLNKFFYPLSSVLVRSTGVVNKRLTRKRNNISMDELSEALEVTDVEENGEKEMLEEIIKFGDKTVEDVMTSRVDMTDIDILTSFKELVKTIVESGYSRIPVYETTQDNIKGVIYIKDLLPHINKQDHFRWQSLIRPAYFVPETKRIDDLLEEFRANKTHMAVVVDEFGGTSGIVTMEDILEEIVGEISDEYDDEDRQYNQLDDHNFIFEGKTQLNDFYKITGTDDDDFSPYTDEADTLAGVLLEIKGGFPSVKEKIEFGKYTFLILEVNKRRIIKVKVTINPENTERT